MRFSARCSAVSRGRARKQLGEPSEVFSARLLARGDRVGRFGGVPQRGIRRGTTKTTLICFSEFPGVSLCTMVVPSQVDLLRSWATRLQA